VVQGDYGHEDEGHKGKRRESVGRWWRKGQQAARNTLFLIRNQVYDETCTVSSFRIRIYDNSIDLSAACRRRSLQSPNRLTYIATFAKGRWQGKRCRAARRFALAMRFWASELDKLVKLGFVCTLQQLGYA
jgi:hypothetical protein